MQVQGACARSFSMDDQAKILQKLLNKLEISGKLILIAHSMGGPMRARQDSWHCLR
jgi:hypothetical protein